MNTKSYQSHAYKIKPTKFISQVANVEALSAKYILVTLKLVDPKIINFSSGQFISINVGEDTYRPYSIASSNKTTSTVDLIIEISHTGAGADYCKSLKVGDTVEFIGPSGNFILPENTNGNMLFIATGSGIAPIYSILLELAHIKTSNNIYLLFGVRNESELFFIKQLDLLKKSLRNFDYQVCFSKELPAHTRHNYVFGRVTKFIPAHEASYYFVCGNPYMVNDVKGLLLAKGVAPAKIVTEEFSISE